MLEAYALPKFGNRVIGLRAKMPLLPADKNTTWVNFTLSGTWKGHQAGEFSFDGDTYKQIISNFKARQNPVVFTYEHPDYRDGQPKPAAGWILDLKVEDGCLWGLCQFTNRAASMIREAEYKFCSVVVDFSSKDRKTADAVGAELLQVGLTNDPFIDGQQPIALARMSGKRKLSMDNIDIAAALKALGLPDNASPEQAAEVIAHGQAAIQAQGSGGAAEEAPSAEGPMAGPDMEAPAEADMASMAAPPADAAPSSEGDMAAASSALQKLMEITGKDAAGAVAFLEQNKEAIANLADETKSAGMDAQGGQSADLLDDKNSPMRANRADLMDGVVAKLTARLEALEAEKKAAVEAAEKIALEAKTNEAKRKVQLAIEKGRIPESDADKWVALATTAPAEFDGVIATLVPFVPMDVITTAPQAGPIDFTITTDVEQEIRAYDATLAATVQLNPEMKDPAKRRDFALKDIKRRRGLDSGRA